MNDITKLIAKKRVGDIIDVAHIIGESADYTNKLLRRPGAKKHQKAVDALVKVIAAREALIQENTDTTE